MPNPPSQSVADPYGGAISYNPPPAPGAPTTGAPNVLSMTVPAEGTCIQMGAASAGPGGSGTNPGIRMRTDNHIHLTAGSPLTTISLGAAGGEVADAGVGGLSVYTAGDGKIHIVGTKTEHVEALVTENYDASKNETVGGTLIETYQGNKTENITGPLLVNVTNPATFTYSSTLGIESAARTEKVHGAWTVDPIEGNYKVHATGTIDMKGDADHKWLQMGDAKHLFMGVFFKLTIGTDTAINIANKNDLRVAIHTDTRIGAHIDTKLAFVMENRAGPLIKNGTLKCQTDILKNEQAAMEKKQDAMRLDMIEIILCKHVMQAHTGIEIHKG